MHSMHNKPSVHDGGFGSAIVPILFGVFWSSMVLIMDGVLGYAIVQQLRALSYPTTQGIVTASRATMREFEVKYAYLVNNVPYTGNRYRCGSVASKDSAAEKLAEAMPLGKSVTVYYAPGDPADSVLLAGIEGCDLLMAMILTPFNLVMVWIWARVFALLGRRPLTGTDGMKIVDDGFATSVRLPSFSPKFIAGCTLFAASFLAYVPLNYFAGFHPSMATMIAAWGIIVVTCMIAWGIASYRRAQGYSSLRIDDATRCLTLPATQGRPEPMSVAAEQIAAIDIVKRVVRSRSSRSMIYTPVLTIRGPEGYDRQEKIADWDNGYKADQFVDWLRTKLQLPSQPASK